MTYVSDYYSQTPAPSQSFGAPRDGGARQHTGADFSHSTKPGTVAVPSPVSGVVTASLFTSGYGWRLEIGPWSFSHLAQKSPLAVGARVAVGEFIGYEGETGWTSGPCCHVELVQGGRRVDPVPFLHGLSAAVAATAARPAATPERLPIMLDVSIVLAGPNNKEQWATGSRGRVHLNEQTSILLQRWYEYLAAGADVDRAGAMTIAEMDILRLQVLSKVSWSAISVVRNVDKLDELWAVGPGDRVHLTPTQWGYLRRWQQYQINGARMDAAGGLSLPEIDILLPEVLQKITAR